VQHRHQPSDVRWLHHWQPAALSSGARAGRISQRLGHAP
jgi:hypothetical protein